MQVMGDDEITPRVLWSVWGTLFLRVTLQIKSQEKHQIFRGYENGVYG